MDNWLKYLVSAACVVVILGGAYLAWGEIASHLKASEINQYRRSETRKESARADLERRLSQEECIRMAKETLPERRGEPVRTTKYYEDLSACDDLKRFDANWRQALDMAGVF